MAVGQVGEGVIVIGADSRSFSKDLHEQTSKASKSAGEDSGNAFTEGVERVVKRGAQLVGAGIGTTLFVGFKTAMDDEVAKMKFTQLFKGQVDKAEGFIEDLKKFAAQTPFEFPGLEDAASRFLAVGVEADKVIPIMTNLGNITGIMGSGEEGVKRVTLALQQMALKGKVSSEEILQMSEAGVPALKLLSEQMGIPTGELQKMIEKGLVPASNMFDAFGNNGLATMQTFQGGMEKMSQTTEGKLSTLKDNFSQFAARLVADAVPAINSFVSTLSDNVIPAVEGGIKSFREWVSSIDFTPFLDAVKLVWQYVQGFANDATVREWADRAVVGVQALASWVKDTLAPALVDLIGKIRDVANWFRENEGAARAMQVAIGVALALVTAAWVAQGVVAVENGIKSVIAWMATATASTTSSTIQSKSTAQIVFGWVAASAAAVWHGAVIVGQWVLMGLAAVRSAAETAILWLMYQVEPAKAALSAVAAGAMIVASWIAQAVAATANAIVIAAAWLLSIWPIALVIAAVVGLAIIIAKNMESIKDWISGAWDWITSTTYNTWQTIYNFFENIWNSITSWISNALDNIKGWINAAWEWIKSATAAAWDVIKWFIFGPIGAIVLFVTNNLDTIKAIISGAWENIKSWTSGAWNAVKDFIATAWENIKTAVSQKVGDLIGFVQGIPGRIVGALGDFGRLLFDKGKEVIQGLWDGMTEIWNKVTGWIGGIVNWIKEHKGPLSLDRELLKPAGSAIMKGFEEGLNSGKDPILKGLTNFTGAIGSIVGGRVKVGNEWLDTDTFAKISAALGSAWRLFQGSWSTRVAASFGTHAGSGVADLAPTGISFSAAEARLRAAGLAAWFRNWPGNLHIHLVNPAMAGLSPQAAAQVQSFLRGGSGLGYASGTRAATPGWSLVGERGPEWMRFRGGETVLPNGRSPGTTITVTMNVSVDDLDKMSKIGDFIDMIDRARLDNRRTARSGMVAA